jgi:predicted RNA methylase
MFGLNFSKVNSIELDEINFEALLNNVNTYMLQDKIKLYNDDTTKILDKLDQDVIYIDAPWGGKSYKEHKELKLYLGEYELADLYLRFSYKAKLFVYKVPLNYDIKNLINKIKDAKIHTYTFYNIHNRAIFNIIIIIAK